MSLLSLDYTNCLASSIGATHGLNDNEVDTLIAKIPKHHEHIAELEKTGASAFFNLPDQDTSELTSLLEQHKGNWEDLIVAGIGGATIGPRCLMDALAHEQQNLLDKKQRQGPRVLFIDNSDPHSITETLGVVNLKKTLFLLISKSGTTPESVGLYVHIQQLLSNDVSKTAPSKQLIVCTQRDKSPLSSCAEKDNSYIIDVPANLGARFNILSTPSLFVAGMCGIDVGGLLHGAADMKKRCWHGDAWSNPAYMHALVHYLLTRKRRKTIHAMMGFSNRLSGCIQWYDHILAVSLGKMLNNKGKAVHVGPSPSSCLGPNGLHGHMQLYAEGPFDKVLTFIKIQDHGSSITIPEHSYEHDALSPLSGQSIESLIDHAYITAAHTITEAGRPNMTIELDQVNAPCLGALVYMLQLSTVMSAELYGIDAFDQPGVDGHKQDIFAQLGRAGFEDKASTLAAYSQRPSKKC